MFKFKGVYDRVITLALFNLSRVDAIQNQIVNL